MMKDEQHYQKDGKTQGNRYQERRAQNPHCGRDHTSEKCSFKTIALPPCHHKRTGDSENKKYRWEEPVNIIPVQISKELDFGQQ